MSQDKVARVKKGLGLLNAGVAGATIAFFAVPGGPEGFEKFKGLNLHNAPMAPLALTEVLMMGVEAHDLAAAGQELRSRARGYQDLESNAASNASLWFQLARSALMFVGRGFIVVDLTYNIVTEDAQYNPYIFTTVMGLHGVLSVANLAFSKARDRGISAAEGVGIALGIAGAFWFLPMVTTSTVISNGVGFGLAAFSFLEATLRNLICPPKPQRSIREAEVVLDEETASAGIAITPGAPKKADNRFSVQAAPQPEEFHRTSHGSRRCNCTIL